MEGDIDIETVTEFGKEAGKLLSKHGCKRILNDARKANVKLSTLEIHDLPQFIETAGVDPLCKRALIVSQDFDDYKFFENVSLLKGHMLGIFADTETFSIFRSAEEARDWLGLPPATADSQ
jgi:hypothetical protein